VYRTPQQQGKAPIVVLNGDPLGIECFIEGQVISDVRPGNGSNIWLGVVTANGAGFIPEANSGYIDEHTLQRC
jgi:hypothetical protein